MSYALQIWEKPAESHWPKDVDEADKLVHALSAARRGQNPKFIAFAQRLTSRYPCITSPEAEKLPESEWAWSEGPLNGKTDKAVYGVGLSLERLSEVRPFVVEQARSLGLNVLDSQAGEVFLADGTVLRAGATAPASAEATDDVPTRRAVEQLVFDRLAPVLSAYGFKAKVKDRSFRRTFSGGWHAITLYVEDNWPLNCEFRMSVMSRFDAVTSLIASIISPQLSSKETAHWHTTALGLGKWLDDAGSLLVDDRAYRVSSQKQAIAAIEHLLRNIRERLIPVLERYQTIEGLEALLNPIPIAQSMFFDSYPLANKHIIAAYLAKNPNLELICEEILTQLEARGYADEYKQPIYRCVEFVRRERLK